MTAGTAPMAAPGSQATGRTARPRVGFLGVGWIGRHRMKAILDTGAVEAAAIADPSPEMAAEAARLAPGADLVSGLDGLLDAGVDGVVIATPSALHAEQSIRALERGAAVFCQKPLGRTAAEARAVVDAARAADRLLAVDLSYRFTEGMRRIREVVAGGGLGRVYAVDLVFHNAYGPDKPWFYDPALSGGGCVMDLGVHLVDLALWTLDFPGVSAVSGTLFAGGEPLGGRPDRVEDYAVATMTLETGAVVQLACSWRLQAGCDAMISAAFYGTEGGAALRNVGGSFYDFTAERYRGTARETLTLPPDEWGGRAAADWATRLAAGERFDPSAERLVSVARVLDGIYGR
ncbi:Gfo/Idh/MocA family protein [Arenibaculum pallidiluteum]|uniref:Gfo/Idh/MocA family protein n=1 Tax=Arenibaculum pallidiluteum TaxID=2812559 RepID=UPI001F3FFADF|nr:Gfo/Idh/MocA family oxidoreductase [Arenibaculum pallidiluteum]